MTNQNPQQPPPRTLAEKIIDAACLYYKCSFEDLKKRDYIEHRKIVVYLLREDAMLKMLKIGQIFGYYDHSWPSLMVDQIRQTKDNYNQIKHDIDNLRKIIDTLV